MSDFDDNIHTEPHFDRSVDGERDVDRLVDGELGEADRRVLLLQLEHEPDGWRRCALAFLEAQCWKAELGQVIPPAGPAVAPPALQVEPIPRRQTWRQYAATTLAIAASFLFALVVVRSWSGGSHSPDSSVLVTTIDESPLANRDAATSVPASPNATAMAGAGDWEMVTLPGSKSVDGQPEAIRVPAQRRDALDRDLLERTPGAISPELQQAFEQSGHRVVQQRQIVPFQMKDGRRLVVPVDHYEIHYVGLPSL